MFKSLELHFSCIKGVLIYIHNWNSYIQCVAIKYHINTFPLYATVSDTAFPSFFKWMTLKSWTIKKAEHWRIDAFELWCWRRLLRVPWTARRSNQSILKEISPEYSLEGLMLKLKLQYFGHLIQRIDSLGKTLMLGKIEGKKRRGWQNEMVGWHHWLNGHEFEQALGVGDGQGSLTYCSPWGCKGSDKTEQLNWTELTIRHYELRILGVLLVAMLQWQYN